ncbi:MAG: hypothetical protein R2809_14850 [Flavobacteriales bacterium]
MKKIFATLFFSVCAVFAIAQAPQMMSFQAVARNASNELIVNSTISCRVNILQGSATGIIVFQEDHAPSTNANGLFSLYRKRHSCGWCDGKH